MGTEEEKGKYQWEMTRADWFIHPNVMARSEEYLREGWGDVITDALGSCHRHMVKTALKEGLPVPAEVLVDYPELVAMGNGID